ncbi:MAG: hypothetical protein E5Y56_33115, partial [Mesorhizobium sp.]
MSLECPTRGQRCRFRERLLAPPLADVIRDLLRPSWYCASSKVPSGVSTGRWDMDIEEWLRGLELQQYVTAFRENNVEADVLLRLTAEDLKDIGVS